MADNRNAPSATQGNAPGIAVGHVNARGRYVPIAQVMVDPKTGRTCGKLDSQAAREMHGHNGPRQLDNPHDLARLLGIPRDRRDALAADRGREFADITPDELIEALAHDPGLSVLSSGPDHAAIETRMERQVRVTREQILEGDPKQDAAKLRQAFSGYEGNRRVMFRRERNPQGEERLRPVEVERGRTPEALERLVSRYATMRGLTTAGVDAREASLHADPEGEAGYLVTDRPGAQPLTLRAAPSGEGYAVRRGAALAADLEAEPELLLEGARDALAKGLIPSEAAHRKITGSGDRLQQLAAATSISLQAMCGVCGAKAAGYAARLDLPAPEETERSVHIRMAAGDGLRPDALVGTTLAERNASPLGGSIPARASAESLRKAMPEYFAGLDETRLGQVHARAQRGAEIWEASWDTAAVRVLIGPEAAQAAHFGRTRAVGSEGPIGLQGSRDMLDVPCRSYADFLASRRPQKEQEIDFDFSEVG